MSVGGFVCKQCGGVIPIDSTVCPYCGVVGDDVKDDVIYERMLWCVNNIPDDLEGLSKAEKVALMAPLYAKMLELRGRESSGVKMNLPDSGDWMFIEQFGQQITWLSYHSILISLGVQVAKEWIPSLDIKDLDINVIAASYLLCLLKDNERLSPTVGSMADEAKTYLTTLYKGLVSSGYSLYDHNPLIVGFGAAVKNLDTISRSTLDAVTHVLNAVESVLHAEMEMRMFYKLSPECIVSNVYCTSIKLASPFLYGSIWAPVLKRRLFTQLDRLDELYSLVHTDYMINKYDIAMQTSSVLDVCASEFDTLRREGATSLERALLQLTMDTYVIQMNSIGCQCVISEHRTTGVMQALMEQFCSLVNSW